MVGNVVAAVSKKGGSQLESTQEHVNPRTYPLEMEVLYGFMGKSWEYMGIPSGYVKIAIENGPFSSLVYRTCRW